MELLSSIVSCEKSIHEVKLMIQQNNALKLLEISANLASSAIQAKAAANNGSMSETELKDLFSACVDMVYEKFEGFPCSKEFIEKFATISEMHQIFTEKFVEIDRKLATLPHSSRTSRRPG